MFEFNKTKEQESARDFLHFLLNAYGSVSKPPNKVIEQVFDAWETWEDSGTDKPLDTKNIVENNIDYFVFYYKDIISICELEKQISNPIEFGIIPINNFNAFCHTLKNNDRAIIVDEKLIVFFTEAIISIMSCVYTKPNKKEVDFFESFILRQLDCFFFRGEKSKDSIKKNTEDFLKVIKRDYDMTEVGSYFSMAFTVFIICHEISHILLNHSKQKKMYDFNKKTGDSFSVAFDYKSYKEEFDADEYGYKLFLQVIKNSNKADHAKLTEYYNRAPLIFLELIDIAYTYAVSKGIKIEHSNTHPPPLERKQKLINLYSEELHSHGVELYEGFMEFSQHIRKVIS